MGRPILVKLDAAFKTGKIKLAVLPEGLDGLQKGDGIEMNQQLANDPAKLSVGLVHEGYHLAANRQEAEIDEEIHSRELQGRYWQHLMGGIAFEGKTYTVGTGIVLEAYRNDQVIDWVLGLPDYSDHKDFLTQHWVAVHIQDWKGPANRNFFTKQKYIAVLLKRPDLLDIGPGARALFAILKASTPHEAKALIAHAGDGNFAKGLALVQERIGKAMWGATAGTTEFVNSILRWQKETAIDLGVVAAK